MTNTYSKPETKTINVESQQIMAGSIGHVTNLDPVTPGTEDAKGFDFFAPLEEQEESTRVSTTNEEEWDEFEEEEI